MNQRLGRTDRAVDAGAAPHHWLFAIIVGALFGAVGVLANWIVLRALT